MKLKRGTGSKFSLRQYWRLTSIFLLIFPLNYTGKTLTTRNDTIFLGLKLPNNSQQINTRIDIDIPDSLMDGNVANHSVVTSTLVVIFTIVQIVSAALLGLIFKYSRNVSLTKECLLLYIFQETTKSIFLINLIGYVSVITCLMGNDQVTISKISAQIISYFYCCFTLHVLITLNAMALLKVRMAREIMLDPPLPWENCNDRTVFNRFRLANTLAVVIFVSALYLSEGYPYLYFLMIGNDTPFFQLPTGTITFTLVLALLICIYIANSVRYQYYNLKGFEVARNNLFPMGVHLMALTIAWILFLVLFFYVFTDTFKGGKIWITILLYQIKTTVITPVYVMIATPGLQTYTCVTLKKFSTISLDNLKYISARLSFMFSNRRAPRIEPYEVEPPQENLTRYNDRS